MPSTNGAVERTVPIEDLASSEPRCFNLLPQIGCSQRLETPFSITTYRASQFLTMLGFHMGFKLQLERSFVFFSIRPVARSLRAERDRRTRGTSRLNGYVAQPFCYAHRGLLHRCAFSCGEQARVHRWRSLPLDSRERDGRSGGSELSQTPSSVLLIVRRNDQLPSSRPSSNRRFSQHPGASTRTSFCLFANRDLYVVEGCRPTPGLLGNRRRESIQKKLYRSDTLASCIL